MIKASGACPIPDPLKDQTNGTPPYEPITTLGKLGDDKGVDIGFHSAVWSSASMIQALIQAARFREAL